MKTLYIAGLVITAGLLASCGHIEKSIEAKERTIQVTGSADMKVIPDQIEFLIEIQEYYEEEYTYGKKPTHYSNKVHIQNIEEEVLGKLSDLGIQKSQITFQNVGHYWRYQVKKRMVSKLLSIQVKDLEVIDKIIANINLRGISYMRIGELQHEDLQEYRKEVKSEALRAAREKAEYLLYTMDKEVGEVITIREISTGGWNSYWSRGASMANSTVSSGQTGDGANSRTINLRYEIETTFEIM